MAGVITTGAHPKALWPGMHAFWGRKYAEHPTEWPELFESDTSEKNYEEDTEVTGFGLAPVKAEGASVSFDSESQGPTTRYTHVAYSLGYIVTREEMDDNLYEVVSKRRIGGLAFSMRQTKEVVGANIYNRGFNASFAGGDGKELLATDHPTVDGTQSNELAVPADLSEAALEDLMIQIANATNSRGLRIALRGTKLIVPPNLMFEAERILKSTLRVETGNNDINALRSMNMLGEGAKVNHYLTDTDAWFVRTNVPNGMQYFTRIGIEFTQDNDFDTSNAKAKAYERYSYGHTDWRGLFGSAGS